VVVLLFRPVFFIHLFGFHVAGSIQDTPGSMSNCWPVERLVSSQDSGVVLSSSGSRSLSCDKACSERHSDTSL